MEKINIKLLKDPSEIIAPSITKLINRSIQNHTFPSSRKCSKVFPLYKSGDRANATNYRPISVLPALSKLMEKAVYTQLYDYLTEHNILNDNQFGFSRKCSTTTALSSFADEILASMEKREVCGAVFLDLSKAFDTVDHAVMLKKLSAIGVSTEDIAWFASYLSFRSLRTTCGLELSEPLCCNFGVPQGSILGPLLFLIYINEIPSFIKHAQLSLDADDTVLYYFSNTSQDLEEKLSAGLRNVCVWLNENKLTLNTKKTKFMIIGSSRKLSNIDSVTVKVAGSNIERVEEFSYLGITFSTNMTWTEHVNQLCSKISKRLGLLKRIKHLLPRYARLLFYKSLILPLFDYGDLVWGDKNNDVLMGNLQILQNKAAKVILDYHRVSVPCLLDSGSEVSTITEFNIVRVAGKCAVRIPASSVTTIPATGWGGQVKCEMAMVEPVVGQHLSHLVVLNTLVRPSSPFCVRVANLTNDDLWIQPRTRIGVLHAVSNIESSVEFKRVSVNEEIVTVRNIESTSIPDVAEDIEHPCNGLSPEQQEKLDTLLNKHASVFSKSDDDIGYTEVVKHRIRTEDDIPVTQPYRRIPPNQYQEVKEHIQKLLDSSIIRESHSPYASPIVLVRKKNGSLRLCVDYRKLNSRTRKDSFPLPCIDESLDALNGAQWFTTLDLASGFNQVAVEEEDKPKTAFTTPVGLFEYNRMPFGLCGAPATFQRLMQSCLHDQIYQLLLVYLDDVIIFSKTFDEHLERLDKILTRLAQQGLKIKREKCSFLRKEVSYLGYVVSSGGVSTDPDKIHVVKNWPVPKTVKELRLFLGFASYYRRFVKDFSKIADPLHDLQNRCLHEVKLKKHLLLPFPKQWKIVHQQAFDEILISSKACW